MAVTNYVWDELSDSVLMETDGSGATTAVYTQEPGPFGGLISQRRGNQSRYYHYDGLGSTRQLTDATGQVTDTYLYDAFGSTVQNTGTTVNPFRFVGRLGYYFDEDLGEYYVRARHYDPRVGRWLAVDPIAYEGYEFNVYRYVRNKPLLYTDPSGLWELRCRPLAGILGQVTNHRHCWVECGGHSYSLTIKGKTATPIIDSPLDKGKGKVEKSGPDNGGGCCSCIAQQMQANMATYAYGAYDCNSNYRANELLQSCGVFLPAPDNATGWGDCKRPEGEFRPICWPGGGCGS